MQQPYSYNGYFKNLVYLEGTNIGTRKHELKIIVAYKPPKVIVKSSKLINANGGNTSVKF